MQIGFPPVNGHLNRISTAIFTASNVQGLMHVGNEMRKESQCLGPFRLIKLLVFQLTVKGFDCPDDIAAGPTRHLLYTTIISHVNKMPWPALAPLWIFAYPVGPTTGTTQRFSFQQTRHLVGSSFAQVKLGNFTHNFMTERTVSIGIRHR